MSSIRIESDEAPETPAHIFAIRAFRTALFGTPAAISMVNTLGDPSDEIARAETPISDSRKCREMHLEAIKSAMSPVKSILLTPGATTVSRKTVSFSGLRGRVESTSSDGSPPVQCLISSQPVPEKSAPTTSTVRRSLFRPSVSPQGVDRSTQLKSETIDPDSTVDLKSPKSMSGRHWKDEYLREHNRTQTEMKRLIRYSQVAKSYAAKRDAEASRMREKLEQAEAKITQLEGHTVQLASELSNLKCAGPSQSRLMEELATQTAAAIRQRQRAERYRAALQDEKPTQSDKAASSTSDASEGVVLHPINSNLSVERTSQLEQENAKLKDTIARVKQEMLRYEERHGKWQETQRRRDERSAARTKALEQRLERSHKENRRLQKEVEATQKLLTQHTMLHAQTAASVPKLSSAALELNAKNRYSAINTQAVRPSEEKRSSRSWEAIRPGHEPLRTMHYDPNGTGSEPVSLRKRPVLMHIPRPMQASPRAKNSPQEETLDLWCLANDIPAKASTGTNGPVSTVTARSTQNCADSNGAIGDALWDSLKRRTSMSLLGNAGHMSLQQALHGLDGHRGVDPLPIKDFRDQALDKENIVPCSP